jgi:hypothetical protein
MQATSISADCDAIENALREAKELASNFAPEVVNRLLNFLDLGLEVSGVELLTAAGASEVCVRLKLPDRFVELTMALRTGNIDLDAFV